MEEAFNYIGREVISFHRIKKSQVNEKQLIEELRGSMISGYDGGCGFSDSCLGGPTTEIDGGNSPTIYNNTLALTQPKVERQKEKN